MEKNWFEELGYTEPEYKKPEAPEMDAEDIAMGMVIQSSNDKFVLYNDAIDIIMRELYESITGGEPDLDEIEIVLNKIGKKVDEYLAY